MENVRYSIKPLNDATKYGLIFAFFGCLAIISSVFITYFTLKLQYPKKSEEEWPLGFFISLSDDSTQISLKEIWEGSVQKKSTFQNLFGNDDSNIETILRALGTVSKIFPPIKRKLEDKFPYEIKLSSNEVMDFLKHPKDIDAPV